MLGGGFLLAQDSEEDQKTFLESKSEGKTLSYGGDWTWMNLANAPNAYEVCIANPSQWNRCYFCIDGNLAKIVSPNKNCFKSTFNDLEPGDHTVSVFFECVDGSFGLLETTLTI